MAKGDFKRNTLHNVGFRETGPSGKPVDIGEFNVKNAELKFK